MAFKSNRMSFGVFKRNCPVFFKLNYFFSIPIFFRTCIELREFTFLKVKIKNIGTHGKKKPEGMTGKSEQTC